MDDLSPQEQAYFTSGGESDIPAAAAPEAPQADPAPAPSPEPAQTAEPAPAPSAQPAEAPPAPEQPKTVDIRALHEERALNREIKAQLAQAQRSHALALERLQALELRVAPPNAPPQFEQNPAEYLKSKVETIEQQQVENQQRAIANARVEQFKGWYQAQAADYAKTQPDFLPAYNAFGQARIGELHSAGLTIEQAQQKFIVEEAEIAFAAGKAGINPAQMMYQAALAKGYKPAPAPKPAPSQNTDAGTGGKLETVKRGMEASRPLSNVGGGGQSENLTWDWVASAPDHEFLAAWKKMEKAEETRH